VDRNPIKTKSKISFQPAGKIVHDAFKELLKAANARKQTFLVGVVEQLTENGAQLRPKLRYAEVARRFFQGLRHTVGPLGTAQSSGLPLGRVTVHPDDVHTMKIRVRDNWRAVKDVGWWIGQENPADLRQMQINAIRFVMETKVECNELRRFYVEVEDGFLRFQGAPFLPVYMVPTDKGKWPKLAEVLLKILKSLRSLNWVDRFCQSLRKVDPALVDEWNRVLRGESSGDGEVLGDDEEEFVEAEENGYNNVDDSLHGRLFHLGRVDRQKASEGDAVVNAAEKNEGKKSHPASSDEGAEKEGDENVDMEDVDGNGDEVFTSVYL
jgi:hypothetical protein